MSERSVSRALLRLGVLTTVVALAFGATPAFAQDDPASTPPAPAETAQPPSSEPAPPPAGDPAPQPARDPEPIATTGGVDGVLFADKNRNGQQDPGEAIANSSVRIFGGSESAEQETTSAADGRFSFRGLAPGTYHQSYELEDAWVVHHTKATGDLITVVANEITGMTARAERPYSEQLKATATLDRDGYTHSTPVTTALTITNTTDREINGITAGCDRDNSPQALGHGRGWDVLAGNGITLAAGESREFKITEDLPAGARKSGSVTLDCDFAPFASWNADGASVHAEATVTGGTGSYTMVVGIDDNANQQVDEGEAVGRAKVVLVHPQTGAQVAEGTSGDAGEIEFAGLAVGEYQPVVLGSWAFLAGQDRVHVTEQGSRGNWFLKYVKAADLRATVKFDKPRYESHETVHLDVTISNIGGKTAERVKLRYVLSGFVIADEQWGDMRWNGPGIQIPAGESRTFSVSGKISYYEHGKLTVLATIDFLGRPETSHSQIYGAVDVVQTTGDVSGVVYADKNSNGQQDPGEAAADTVVEVSGGAPINSRRTSTDADGRFSFAQLPSGNYEISYTIAGGWIVHVETVPRFRVEPGPVVQLTARAERPYSEMIKATVVLDKAVYRIGDEATITIRLTNRTGGPIRGIEASCNKIGDGNNFGGGYDGTMPESWGDLRPGKGVTLNPGETRTIVATEKVPNAARWKNRVFVACDFAPNPFYNNDGAYGYDWASVPGGFGSMRGPLFHDRNGNFSPDPGEALPNTRVVLKTHPTGGANVVEAVSDADGNVRFAEVPPGEFFPWVDKPWTFERDLGGGMLVRADEESEEFFNVEPDPNPQPGPGDGAGQDGGAGGALAKTGASVLGLGVVAALLLAFGIGARLAGRRKTA